MVGAAALVELVLAVAVVRPGAGILLVPFAGAVALALAFAFPFATICVFLILVASFLDSALFSVSFGATATGPEAVLALLLVVAVVRPRRRTMGGAPGAAILVFLGIVVIASVLAVSAGRVDSHTSRDFTLPYFYLLFYFVVVRLVPERERVRQLLTVAVGVAAVTGVVAVGLALSGQSGSFVQHLTGGAVSQQAGLQRVRLPGVALAYGLVWYAVLGLMRSERHKLWWGLAVAAMLANIIVSANRNMWIGLLFGLALLVVVGEAHARRRVLAALVALVAAVMLLVLAGPGQSGPTSATSPLVQRGQTLLSPRHELQDQSLRDRGTETATAWRALQGHFAFGLGVGAPFGVVLQHWLPGGRIQLTQQTFIHNQYLYLVVVGGLGAFAAFALLLGATLLDAWRGRRRDAVPLGVFLGLAPIMLSALVMLTYSDYAFLALLALMAGAVRVFRAAPAAEPAPGSA